MIRQMTADTLPCAARLACALWSNHTAADMEAELTALLHDEGAAIYLASDGSMPIGYAQCQLRCDYVEGTSTSPVSYLEGIYVAESYRRQGVARSLLSTCRSWAKTQGCTEFASDCELTNTESLAFHLRLGFTEANRIICFTQTIE